FFVTAPEIRKTQFRDLAYLSWWLGANVPEGERAVIAAPNFTYLMETHDAAWLRGEQTRGAAFWDVESILRDWTEHGEKSVLMIYAGGSSRDLQAYLAWLLPEVPFQLVAGPVGPEKDLLFASVPATPPHSVDERLRRWACQPVKVRVDLVGATGQVLQ